MKRYFSALFVLVTVVFAFSGCFPTGEKQQTEQAGDKKYKSGEKFEYSKEKLAAEFTIPEKLPQATRIALKPKTFDKDELITLFFGDRAYTQLVEVDGSLPEIYNTDDGVFHLDFLGGGISFYNNKVCNYDYPVNYASLKNFCLPREWDYNPPSDNELEGFPRETALQRAEDLLSKLGIENLGEPEVYPMSVDAIKKVVEENNPPYDVQKLSQEHECYVLRYSQLFDGFELLDLPLRFGEKYYDDTKITIVITREEIVYFKAKNTFENSFEVLSQEPVKYDFDYALDEFKSFHEAAFFDEETIIYAFNPIYYPVSVNESGVTEFVPMWNFEGRSVRQEDGFIMRKRYVAAIGSDKGILRTYKGD